MDIFLKQIILFSILMHVCMCSDKHSPKCDVPKGYGNCSTSYLSQCFNCFIVHKNHSVFPVLVCNSSSNDMLQRILYQVNESTEALYINVINYWEGYFPLQPEALNLIELERLTNLRMFMLIACYSAFKQAYPLTFTNTTFSKMTKMEEFVINLPITDTPVGNIVKHFPKLRSLDLSFTRYLTVDTLIDTIRNINNDTLKNLYLITFQLAGGTGYNSTMDIHLLFSGRVFRKLNILALSENSLARISPGIYDVAPFLKRFYISGNILIDGHNLGIYLEALCHPQLEVFDPAYQGYVGGVSFKYRHPPILWFESTSITHSENKDAKYLSSSSLNKYAQKNEMYLSKVATRLSKYNVLTFCFNKLIQYNGTSNASNFFMKQQSEQRKIMSKWLRCILPHYIDRDLSWELFPNVEDLVDASCLFSIKLPIGHKLRTVYLEELGDLTIIFGIKLEGKICFRQNNSMNRLVFSNNYGWAESSKLSYLVNNSYDVYGLQKLQHLDFSNNKLSFSMNDNSITVRTLKTYTISGNDVSFDSEDFQFCKKQPYVEQIDFSDNNLGWKGKLPYNLFKDCKYLKHLNLSLNHLEAKHIEELDLTGLYQIQSIDLSYNNLKFLSENLRRKFENVGKLANQSKLFLNLSNNDLICGCQTTDFTSWISSNFTHLEFANRENYTCIGDSFNLIKLNKVSVHAIFKYKLRCSGVLTIIESVLSTLGVTVVIVLLILSYHHRWKIRYQLFRLQQVLDQLGTNRTENDRKKYEYDIYVCYCSADRHWVHCVLLKTLQVIYSFKLYIRMREGDIGAPIADDILDKMKKSREIVIILSNHALRKEWFQYELQHAQIIAQQRRKRLIIITLGELILDEDARLAAAILDTDGCLEWNDEMVDQTVGQIFWCKLVRKLYNVHCSLCRRKRKSKTQRTPLIT